MITLKSTAVTYKQPEKHLSLTSTIGVTAVEATAVLLTIVVAAPCIV